MIPAATATIDDLMRVDGKAELIGGRIIPIIPTGYLPGKIAFHICLSLHEYALATGEGEVIADNIGYIFEHPLPSGRQSISPDASFFTGSAPANRMRFISGFPLFAVEVRSEHDYGPAADQEYEDKREDYFSAGTQAVWDVDPVAGVIALYRAADPKEPILFHRGEVAHAEPVLPGWKLSVDRLYL